MKKKAFTVGCIAFVVIFVALTGFVVIGFSSTLSTENISETVELAGCSTISGVIGPEDFEYLPQENGLVVSSINRRAPEDTVGQLYWIDLTKPVEAQVAEPIVMDYPQDFRPHGITFQRTEAGGRLFVISHPSTGEWQHTIEVFSLTLLAGTRKWEHVQTLTDELLLSPNDLVALSDGTLFIVHDNQGLAGGLAGVVVDALLQRKRAPLVFYDGDEFIDLDTNVMSGAGTTVVKEGAHEFLYISDYMNNALLKFKIHWNQRRDPRVELVETIHLDSGPDNLTVDEKGNLYVAAHYSIGLLLEHQRDENTPSPTQVFRILPNGEYTLLYANQGEEISAGSVGAVAENRLLVGQIFDDGILSCPMNQ